VIDQVIDQIPVDRLAGVDPDRDGVMPQPVPIKPAEGSRDVWAPVRHQNWRET